MILKAASKHIRGEKENGRQQNSSSLQLSRLKQKQKAGLQQYVGTEFQIINWFDLYMFILQRPYFSIFLSDNIYKSITCSSSWKAIMIHLFLFCPDTTVNAPCMTLLPVPMTQFKTLFLDPSPIGGRRIPAKIFFKIIVHSCVFF